MIKVDKNDLKYMMEPIVNECLRKYEGGEGYFNELDKMIKDNETLLVLFLLYAVQDSLIYNVILSGGIGLRYMQLQLQNKIPNYINEVIPESLSDKPIIFIDDSYYSGKTAKKVDEFLHSRGTFIFKTYVFYDGCKDKCVDVESLYRYYD